MKKKLVRFVFVLILCVVLVGTLSGCQNSDFTAIFLYESNKNSITTDYDFNHSISFFSGDEKYVVEYSYRNNFNFEGMKTNILEVKYNKFPKTVKSYFQDKDGIKIRTITYKQEMQDNSFNEIESDKTENATGDKNDLFAYFAGFRTLGLKQEQIKNLYVNQGYIMGFIPTSSYGLKVELNSDVQFKFVGKNKNADYTLFRISIEADLADTVYLTKYMIKAKVNVGEKIYDFESKFERGSGGLTTV